MDVAFGLSRTADTWCAIPACARQTNPKTPSRTKPAGFEKTTALITGGIYAHIRHPLYSSLLLLAWGISFKAPSLPGVLLAHVSTTFLIATARADEAECIRFFGDEYQEYMRTTKRFIPFLF